MEPRNLFFPPPLFCFPFVEGAAHGGMDLKIKEVLKSRLAYCQPTFEDVTAGRSLFSILTLCSDGHQFDSLAGNEVQGFVHVVDLVDPHLSSLGLW